MKLDDYLHFNKNKITKKEFAKQAGIPYATFNRILQGHETTLSTAKRIVDASKGQVTYEDLIKLEKIIEDK